MPRSARLLFCCLALAAPAATLAQSAEDVSPAASSLPVFAGPAAPMAPEVFAEDAEGRITLRATRLAAPLTVDGALDEAAYRDVKPITGFIQQEPRQGEPATERTESWILFDDDNLYIACARNDSQPEREVANELRRDNGNILGNENLTFAIDTLHDRRNGYLFQTNPLGALRDRQSPTTSRTRPGTASGT